MPRTRSGAGTSQPAPQATPEEQAYADSIHFLSGKTIESSLIIDRDVLAQLGIKEDFDMLTRRLGIRRAFWDIARTFPAYEELTREFLGSVILHEDPYQGDFLSFMMMGRIRQVSLMDLQEWFHFRSPQTCHFGYSREVLGIDEDPIPARAFFWYRLTGEVFYGSDPDHRVSAIIHPVLRFICRALGQSIFARGESSLRPTHDELRLLATMLRPDMERPDLMLLMARHWTTVRRHGKSGGKLMGGSYITCIANHLHLPYQDLTHAGDPRTIDLRLLRSYQWITSIPSPSPTGRDLSWRLADGRTFPLPIDARIDLDDHHSWRLALPPHMAPQVEDSDQGEGADMHEASPGYDQAHFQHQFPHPGAHPQQAPEYQFPPQMYTMLQGITSAVGRLEDGQRYTHDELRALRRDQQGSVRAMQQLTERVAGLEMDPDEAERRRRRRRQRRRVDGSGPSGSQQD